MVDENKKTHCEICNGEDISVIYQGPIRDGAFGSTIEKSQIYKCNTCGISKVDENDSFEQKNYESSVYREEMGQGLSIDDFFNSSKNNLLSTLKVWDWANKLNIPIVYASSSAIYGNLPLGDDRVEKFDILSPYAQDKLTMEHYANMAWNVYQTKSIGLRFFNVYGPKQDPSNPYSGVISIFIDRLLKGLPLTVNGGYQTRDFVYVKDIVNCLVHSMKEVQNCSLCTSFNVGTGKSVTIDSLLANLIEITKSSPCINKEKLPLGDPEISAGTYEKLKNNLGINIKHFTSLNEGLNLTVKYIIDNERNAKV